jgi:hypothetical protein
LDVTSLGNSSLAILPRDSRKVLLWGEGVVLAELPHDRRVHGVRLVGSTVVTWGHGEVLFWSREGQLLEWEMTNHPIEEIVAAADPDSSDELACAVLAVHRGGKLVTVVARERPRRWGAWGPLVELGSGSSRFFAEARSGSVIVTLCEDESLRAWSLDGRPLLYLLGHSNRIVGMRAHVGKRLLTWSSDRTIRIWELGGLVEQPDRPPARTREVGAVAPLADGGALSLSVHRDEAVLTSRCETVEGPYFVDTLLGRHMLDVRVVRGRFIYSVDRRGELRVCSCDGRVMGSVRLPSFEQLSQETGSVSPVRRAWRVEGDYAVLAVGDALVWWESEAGFHAVGQVSDAVERQ